MELEEIRKHPAMFTCSISSKHDRDVQKFYKAVDKMIKEDPSIVNKLIV